MNEKNQLQLVSFEQAKRLKELRFDLKTSNFYDSTGYLNDYDGRLPAPTVALALKWIRDVEKLVGEVHFELDGFRKGYNWFYFSFENKDLMKASPKSCSSYEKAESMLLDELLNVLEQSKSQNHQL